METLKRILIVDDEKFVTDTLEAFFHNRGYQIFKAEDGQTSLNIITNEKLDLVLLDIKLPKVNGIEILKLLRQYYPKVKVIVMTAYDLEYKEIADTIGYDGFFIKPILIDELIVKVEELLWEGSEQKREILLRPSKKPSAAIPENMLPKARILIVSPRDSIVGLLKNYFTDKNLCNGIYEVVGHGMEELEYIKDFQPDIILLDVSLIGILGEFGVTLMKLPEPPKEIIIFGDPASKWEEAEAQLKERAKFVEMKPDLHAPITDTLQRLNNAVRDTCAKYRLFSEKLL